jgi:hypothetical protein
LHDIPKVSTAGKKKVKITPVPLPGLKKQSNLVLGCWLLVVGCWLLVVGQLLGACIFFSPTKADPRHADSLSEGSWSLVINLFFSLYIYL